MNKLNILTPSEKLEISKFCACLANPTILTIIEELAKQGDSSKDHFIEVEGLSSYTINMNLKYLKRYGYVSGSLVPETPYNIDFEKLEISKKLLDKYYKILKSYRHKK